MRTRILALAALLAVLFAAPALSAPYNIVTSAPFEKVPAVGSGLDTVIVTSASSADTLKFGQIFDWANVYIKGSECVKLQWFGRSDSLMSQVGTAPPAAARRKSRYRALRFSSNLYRYCGVATVGSNVPANWPKGLRGLIYQGTGTADTLHIWAGLN